MVSTGRSGPVFGRSESAGNSLQALTHQPQACHSVSYPTTPGLSLVLPEVGVGWGQP